MIRPVPQAARVPSVSVIIPVWNEAQALPATLAAVHAQSGDFEVFVVDANSQDNTASIANLNPQTRVLQAPRGRASQMNAGAARANSEWLLFLHADTLLPPGAIASISALGVRSYAGGFRHGFSSNMGVLRLISWVNNLRSAKTRVFFGDQALFVRRETFITMGGFDETQRMEDLHFARRLVDERAPGMRLPDILNRAVITDSRKFERMGPWRSLWRVAVILCCAEFGRPLPRNALKFFTHVR